MTTFAARMMLFFIALAVLALQTGAWAAARFLSVPRAAVAAILLNAAFATGGLLLWALRAGEGALPAQRAVSSALVFFLTGLVASALVIGWVRYTVRRRAQMSGQDC